MFSFLSLSLSVICICRAKKKHTFIAKASDLYVTVYKNDETLLSAAAQHAIRATKWTGKLKWDAEGLRRVRHCCFI